MRSLLISSALLLVTIWSVSSGVDDKAEVVVPSGFLCPNCYERAKSVLEKAWTLTDPLVTSYGVLVYNILKFDIPKAQEVCKFLQTSLDGQDGTKTEAPFAISSAITKVSGCKAAALKPALKQNLDKILKEGTNSQDIYYAAETLKNTGGAVDTAKIAELLKAATKADDSPQSLGYALWASTVGFKSGGKLEIWERIEDVIAQADEIDKQYLQFEGGLSVTAAVINGVFRLADVSGKPFPLKNDQVVKFSNYLISRKTFMNPVYIGISGSNVLNDANKVLSVKVADLFGRPVDVAVSLESLTSSTGTKVGDIQLVQAVPSSDKKTFTVDLKSKTLAKGFYKAVLVPKSPKNDKKLILLPTTVQVKVTGKLGAVTARVGVADTDQQSQTKWHDLNIKQKLSSKLELDPSNKLVIKVATSQSLHQVFVILKSKATKKEVAFIAQPESDGKTDYKLELDLTSNAKDLGYNSGAYEITLILGDFFIDDSVEWVLGDVQLQVASGKPKAPNPLYGIAYGPKPEIKHQFRTPEPRPARVLSDAFTILTLSPLLILFILWIKIGANISGFPASLSAVLFHLGLGGIFGVYVLFWIKLTMFEALKLISIPGFITFIFGHRLLSYLSDKRKA
ncbi:Dolichyl-diphosphooligosaccharide--protein glycosyltransferase subunit 2 [Folsomia candida]|uniref:Dolichyl-diphosphooligosaccharide--protein glycosyltransferase subunit 2 n=1 Tax=Folsomia candida TaxID=158441 RepID=A0A226DZG4_FOLCA|nr:Dolichyl-diphosphooligosaccharide--protein glycosyltransferase subunit 2 [Folsomia candida]